MEQAVRAYRQVADSPEFLELERLRENARLLEAQELRRTEARVRAETVLEVLEYRKIEASEADREKITTCTDVAKLRRWQKRALSVPDIASLFADAGPEEPDSPGSGKQD